jgi:hypothetical protein
MILFRVGPLASRHGVRDLKKIPNNKHQITNKFQAPINKL